MTKPCISWHVFYIPQMLFLFSSLSVLMSPLYPLLQPAPSHTQICTHTCTQHAHTCTGVHFSPIWRPFTEPLVWTPSHRNEWSRALGEYSLLRRRETVSNNAAHGHKLFLHKIPDKPMLFQSPLSKSFSFLSTFWYDPPQVSEAPFFFPTLTPDPNLPSPLLHQKTYPVILDSRPTVLTHSFWTYM